MIELAAELGFVETDEMVRLRNKMIKLLKMTDLFSNKQTATGEKIEFKTTNKALDLFDNLHSEYKGLAKEVVNQCRGDEEKFNRAKIGYSIMEAYIYRTGGHSLDYEEKISRILKYASSKGYDDISQRYWIL